MALGRLSALQTKVLQILAGLEPAWTLSGGAALAGFHTRDRETRDLDLFWQGRHELGDVPSKIADRLRGAGLEVDTLQTEVAFSRLRARDGAEEVVLDLVADPVPLAEPPLEVGLEGQTLRVDTAHQILVNKLCAMLARSEVRDLRDVRALLGTGGDLRRALLDAPGQDLGFSSITLAWTLRRWPLRKLALALGATESDAVALEEFRDDLVERLLAVAVPPA